jgi:hypothetical protein
MLCREFILASGTGCIYSATRLCRGQRHNAAALYRHQRIADQHFIGLPQRLGTRCHFDNAKRRWCQLRWDETVWSSRELYHFLAPLCELSG